MFKQALKNVLIIFVLLLLQHAFEMLNAGLVDLNFLNELGFGFLISWKRVLRVPLRTVLRNLPKCETIEGMLGVFEVKLLISTPWRGKLCESALADAAPLSGLEGKLFIFCQFTHRHVCLFGILALPERRQQERRHQLLELFYWRLQRVVEMMPLHFQQVGSVLLHAVTELVV